MNLDPAIFGNVATKPEKVCSVSACGRPRYGNGLCQAHNARRARGLPVDVPIRVWRRRTEPRPPCAAPRCGRPVKNLGLCAGHYRRKFIIRHENWAKPLKLYRRKGQTKDVSARISRQAHALLKRQADGLGRDLGEHVRIILEEHAARVRRMEAA